MFDVIKTEKLSDEPVNSQELLHELGDLQLAMVGGGTGAVNLE